MTTTVKLVGSSYQTDTGGSVSSASKMYNYVSNGDPAHFFTATYNYVKMILNGFDFSVIPNNAVIEAVEYKIKLGEASYNNYGTVQLKGAKNSNPASEEVTLDSKSPTTYTITPTVDFDTIREYGSSFGFCIKANYTDADIRVYGAEIDITYTPPPSVNKVDRIKDGVLKTLIDLTEDNITAADVAQGVTFHKSDGSLDVGTLASAGVKTATYTPSSNSLTATFTVEKEPTFFMCQLYFSSSDTYTSHANSTYYIYSVVGTSDSIYGVTGRRGSSTSSTYTIYSRSSSHLSWSYSGNTLTITSGSSTGAGYFRSGTDYVLIYI